MPQTNYDFVNQIMKKLKNNNADDLLHSTLDAANQPPPQEILFASGSTKSLRRSSINSPVNQLQSNSVKESSKYVSLKERFAPLINGFSKQKRAFTIMNKIKNLVRNFSNMTTYSFKGIEKQYPEIGQFNDYYEHLLQGQNYDDKDMQQILISLEKLLIQDKVNHQLHNSILNNEYNSTNEEVLEAIKSFNILNAS